MALLKNIKVIDLTRFVAGPHCTLVLSDLGAEVIKIEKPGKGDDLRIIGPKLLDTSLWAAVLNRGKKSVSLNLKTKIGKEILLKLIQEADVLVENFRPGVMEKLKLGWKTIKKANNKTKAEKEEQKRRIRKEKGCTESLYGLISRPIHFFLSPNLSKLFTAYNFSLNV